MNGLPRYLAAALGLALGTGALVALAAPWLGRTTALALLLPGLGAAGLAYVQSRAVRPGLATMAWLTWAALAALPWLAGLSLLATVATQSALLWAARCAWWRRAPLAATVEALIALVAVGAFSWALLTTGAPWLAAWCWMLAQAASLCLPFPRQTGAGPDDDRWSRARRTAVSALDRLRA